MAKGKVSKAIENATKAVQNSPEISADKSLIAWVELYATGHTSHLADSGIPESVAKDVGNSVYNYVFSEVKPFPLSDENLEEVAKYYLEYINQVTKIKTSLKSGNGETPVVEITATTIDNRPDDTNDLMNNEGIRALMSMIQKEGALGKTVEDMKNSKRFQTFAVQCVRTFIDDVPTFEHTLEVKCVLGEGDEDGKLYWMPEDPEALASFAMGH